MTRARRTAGAAQQSDARQDHDRPRGPLKRELNIEGKLYTLTLSPTAFNLAPQGRRKGYELAWVDLVSGEAALATALNASLARGPMPEGNAAKAASAKETSRSAQRSSPSPQKSR